MDKELERLISVDNIPGETPDQQAERLSIEKTEADVFVRMKLAQLYKDMPGIDASVDNIVKSLTSLIDNPTANKEEVVNNTTDDLNKEKEVTTGERERSNAMADQVNRFAGINPDTAAPNQNLQGTQALQGKAETKTTAGNDELTESLLAKLSEANLTEADVRAFMADKDRIASVIGGNVRVTKFLAVKKSAKARLEECTIDDVAEGYTLGMSFANIRKGYLVKPQANGTVKEDKLVEQVAKLISEITTKTGYNENGGTPTSSKGANAEHVKDLLNILKVNSKLSQNEKPDRFVGIAPAGKEGDGNYKLVGNECLSADVKGASDTVAIKAVKISDTNAKDNLTEGKEFDELSLQAVGAYMKTNRYVTLLDQSGKASISYKEQTRKKKVNGVDQEYTIDYVTFGGKKNIPASEIQYVATVNKKPGAKVGYIRVNAALPQAITYTEGKSKKSLKVKVYAKVYTEFALNGEHNPVLKVAAAKSSEGSGAGREGLQQAMATGNYTVQDAARLLIKASKANLLKK